MPRPNRKRKFLVSLARPDERIKGISVPGKGRREFSKSGSSFMLSDAGEAREIKKEFGSDVAMSEIPNYKAPEDQGHRYNFTVQKQEETLEERRERMITDGWVEFAPGRWKKVAQIED